MALQHFYSRVPARVSMYNKMDGFDTFACSEALPREFIETELVKVYDNKPTNSDSLLIRDGKLPPVYCVGFSKSGEMYESCISYIPSDYTGERSSYLVHSLKLSDDEKRAVLHTTDKCIISPDSFDKDILPFAVTDPSSRPIKDLPEKTLTAELARDASYIAETYDIRSVKRFLYSLLSVACDNGKSIFLILRDPVEDLSKVSTAFYNSCVQVFPYRLRDKFSFVSYVGDFSRFNTFKIKCVPKDCPDIPLSKGNTINFINNTAKGVKDEEIVQNNMMVDFFYQLLTHNNTRLEFLSFIEQFDGIEGFNLNFKTLTSLIFLFRYASGLYEEREVLPNDDKVCEFLTVYEKFRNYMTPEYRIRSVRCLQRYADQRKAIPKNVFAKMSKIYAGESKTVKRVIMNIVLELIHTDVMRDKLFTFIKNNYKNEDEEMKGIICEDLCRVFYGGFLQAQIVAFFTDNFADESPDTQEMIVDKLMLAIRTKDIQKAVLAFFDRHYEIMTEKAKDIFYAGAIEHLAEGDELAVGLSLLIDQKLATETEERKQEIRNQLQQFVLKGQTSDDHALVVMAAQTEGVCSDAFVEKFFTVWYKRKIFETYVDYVCHLPIVKRVQKLTNVFDVVDNMTDEVYRRFVKCVQDALAEPPKATQVNLYDYLKAKELLAEKATQKERETLSKFARLLAENYVDPVIETSLFDVFKHKDTPNGCETIKEYASHYRTIKASEQYGWIEAYLDIKTALLKFKPDLWMAGMAKIPSDEKIRLAMADYLAIDMRAQLSQPPENGKEKTIKQQQRDKQTEVFTQATTAYLRLLTVAFTEIHRLFVGEVTDREQKSEEDKTQPSDKIDNEALDRTLSLSESLYALATTEEMRTAFAPSHTDLSSILEEYLAVYGKNGRKTLSVKVQEISAKDADFGADLKNVIDGIKIQKGSLTQKGKEVLGSAVDKVTGFFKKLGEIELFKKKK